MQKHLEEKNVYFDLHLVVHHLRGVRAGTQGRTRKVGTEAEAVEESCSLYCSTGRVQPVFLCTPGLPSQRSTIRNELVPPTLTANYRNVSQACPQTNLVKAFYQLWVSRWHQTTHQEKHTKNTSKTHQENKKGPRKLGDNEIQRWR